MVDSEVLFRRLLAVSKKRNVSLEEVLTHELAPVLPCLFNDDGTLRKTSKADLAKKLEPNREEVQVLRSSDYHDTAYLIDGMAMLQALNEGQFDTFDELGHTIMCKIQALLTSNMGVKAVSLIFDRYDCPVSIKHLERQRRRGGENTPRYLISGIHRVPNYRKFRENTTNKAALADFLCWYLVATAPLILNENQSITLAGGFEDGQLVRIVEKTGVTDQHELFSTQEEADTRLVLHAINLASTHSKIIVRCDDTDVLAMLIHYCSNCMLGSSTIYMNAGHCSKETNRQRFILLNSIADKIGTDVSLCLPAAHALSGCDTTSAMFKIGKKRHTRNS